MKVLSRTNKGFSLLEVIIFVGLFSFLIQSMTTAAFALRKSIAKAQTISELEDEKLLIMDEIQHRQPIRPSTRVSMQLTQIESSSTPMIHVDMVLAGTTTQGQKLTTEAKRDIWTAI